jgi:hypothetical protein
MTGIPGRTLRSQSKLKRNEKRERSSEFSRRAGETSALLFQHIGSQRNSIVARVMRHAAQRR